MSHQPKIHDCTVTPRANKAFDLINANTWDLGKGSKAMRGFFSNVRLATARILVNINFTHGAFYDALPLTAVMDRFNGAQGNSHLNQFLKRVRVEITHRVKKNTVGQAVPQIKTIWGLAHPEDGKEKSKEDQVPPKPPNVA